MLEVEDPERTTCCLLVDKEEIGSVGATGMQSRFFENVTAEVMERTGKYSELLLRRCLANSCMLSSDVSAAFDPLFAGSFEKKNAAEEWYLINLPAQEENPALTMPMQNILQRSAGLWMMQVLPSRQQNWEK